MDFAWPSPMSHPLVDFDLPIVDHIHARHWDFHWPFNNTYKLDQEIFYPDVDVRDYETGYTIDIELPGLDDKRSVKVEWMSKHDIVISGLLARPRLPAVMSHRTANGRQTKLTEFVTESSKKDKPAPVLLVGERRAGNFCRKFHLPMSVDAANLRARLEDGLLKIRVDKVRIDQRISGQTQIE
jgi:HSP20 family molecular chaperone IbpA